MPESLPPGYALRGATICDVGSIHRLHKTILPRDAYPRFDLALMMLWPGMVNLKVTAPDGSLAGFVSGSPGIARERGWIVMIGVAPKHQRQGLAAYLLHTCEQRLRRPQVRLTVRQSNATAIRVYERCGYTLVDRKWGYYRDGETGLVMEKRLRDG